MKLKPLLIILLFAASISNGQQDTTIKISQAGSKAIVMNQGSASKAKGLVYNSEFSVGAKLTTSGWGMFGDLTKRVNMDKKRLYYFEIMFMKNPKELKKINEYNFSLSYSSPRPFIYGKQNSFFNAKVAYGNKYLIGQKAEKSGFEVNFDYAIGPSIGIVKPYYLEVLKNQDGALYLSTEKYSPANESYFLDATSIYGYSGFMKGFGDISIIPGAFGKAGLNFDWASYDDYVKSLEVGIGTEVYIKDVPMMILETNKPYFVYLYLSVQFGRKW
ncbi:MAG: hypothetical protein IPG60_12040 [Bacteroidetes bacterium]|nr:hypothetical protein [Bacteroidota bacterium]MBP7400213.1 hypothetical protein [Chitinophagales bacterium]MBK7109688.1 hypothetical protein [Bacteroidota bacterium]MBK8487576.1 hypothetical protein [Bacteroidota bacterium]MBK8682678.1 hypothetical protein [Bacteroidota bacterium]